MRPELNKAIELLQSSDEENVQRALELLQRTVLSFGMKVCGHREDAEDTAQEVLVNALPHLAKLRDPQALTAWLYTAARNRCRQSRRRVSYKRVVALDDLMPDETELGELLRDASRPTPEASVLSGEDHRLLHEALLRLPSTYRLVLVLHDMEELETEVVAKILSLRTGTVRVRLHRARLLLRQEMNEVLQAKSAQEQKSGSRKKTARSPECREIFANLSEYLDGRLSQVNCDTMQRHIDACPACVAFIQDLKRAIDRCRSLEVCPDAAAPPALRRLLTREYLRLLQEPSARP